MLCGGTAAGATPTLIRVGLYEIAADGDGTLVAATANDTSLLAVANTAYEKALSAPYTLRRGQRYAAGLLVVTGATAPTIAGGASFSVATEGAEEPRMNGSIGSQTDLPASFAGGDVGVSGARHYIAFVD